MARAIVAVLGGVLILAGCSPGQGPGGVKARMMAAMAGCDASAQTTLAAINQYKAAPDGAQLNRVKAAADETLAACESAEAAWGRLDLPPAVAGPCLATARSNVAVLRLSRDSLDHLTTVDQGRMQREVDALMRNAEVCERAMG